MHAATRVAPDPLQVHPRLLQFGHIAIPTYGALTALSLVAALVLVVQLARRLSLDANKVWTLSLYTILTTLIGTRLVLVIAHLDAFRQHPFWVLGLTSLQDWWVAPAAMTLGVAAGILYALAEDLPLLRVADCLAPAVIVALTVNRIGAFVAGVDFGAPTHMPWAVIYTSRIAALWYQTPLGIPLHPVQIYDTLAALLVFALLMWWLPRRRQDGELAGGALVLFGALSPLLNLWRADHRGLGFSLTLSVAAVAVGAALWLERSGKPRGYTGTDDSPSA